MKKNKLSAFEQALLDATLEEFQDIPPEDEIDMEFSEEFEAWAQEFLAGAGRGGFRPRGKALRKIIIVAALLAALVTTAVATPAIREGLIGFFTQNKGTHYQFSFDPEQAATAPRTIETEYCPTYIPEGYVEDTHLVTDGSIIRMWRSDKGEYILFVQETIPPESEGPHPNAENVTVNTMELNGYEVFFVQSESEMYFWTDNEYLYSLLFPLSVTEEECIQVFYSILPLEN